MNVDGCVIEDKIERLSTKKTKKKRRKKKKKGEGGGDRWTRWDWGVLVCVPLCVCRSEDFEGEVGGS